MVIVIGGTKKGIAIAQGGILRGRNAVFRFIFLAWFSTIHLVDKGTLKSYGLKVILFSD